MIIFTHPTGLLPTTAPDHPESCQRLQAVLAKLETPSLAHIPHQHADAPTPEQLRRVHDADYLSTLLALHETATPYDFDPDTIANYHTITAALHAAGASVAAVTAIMQGEAKRAFCATRPPGHHAEPNRAMGFCYINNIAIAAAHALTFPAIQRVAIIDFDVHHGNGTQAWAEQEPRALFCSLHQMPLYPGTGLASETGQHHNCVNVPLPAGAGETELRAALKWQIMPRLYDFKPDFLLLSAGFDGHEDDPLGGMQLTAHDYGWLTRELVTAAEDLCAGRVVSCLEGGYDCEALAAAVAAHVTAMQ